MRIKYSKYIISLTVLLLLAWTISCSGRPGKENETTPAIIPGPEEASELTLIKLVSPGENEEYKLNQAFEVILELRFRNRIPDSVAVIFNGKMVKVIKTDVLAISVKTLKLKAVLS